MRFHGPYSDRLRTLGAFDSALAVAESRAGRWRPWASELVRGAGRDARSRARARKGGRRIGSPRWRSGWRTDFHTRRRGRALAGPSPGATKTAPPGGGEHHRDSALNRGRRIHPGDRGNPGDVAQRPRVEDQQAHAPSHLSSEPASYLMSSPRRSSSSGTAGAPLVRGAHLRHAPSRGSTTERSRPAPGIG
jgi:hypothetical protein